METQDEKSKKIVINLKLLGELEMGVKLNTRENYFSIDDTRWDQGARRMWRGDSRNSTYEKVSELVSETKQMLETEIKKNNNDEFKQFMIPILEKASKGLRSLKDTYTSDKTFLSKIDLEIETMERIIKRLNPDYKYQETTNEQGGSFESF